jgi:streptogramin lyase
MKFFLPLILLASLVVACKKNNSSNSNTSNMAGPVIDTIAGNSFQGSANGTGKQASFNFPTGIAVDASGNVYVADNGNNLIRKITPAGVVSTFAGSGSPGYADGTTGTQASFNSPNGIAVDANGNIYVADTYNNLVRKITPGGAVSTLASGFSEPHGVAVDAAGNVYVTDTENNLIRKITPAGVITTLAGSGSSGSTNGTGNQASFNSPYGIAVDAAGNVYVTDTGLVRKITPAGVVSTLATVGGLGITTDSSGNVYVGDGINDVVDKITSSGTVTTLASGFNAPYGVAADAAGNVYITDSYNYLIIKIIPKK